MIVLALDTAGIDCSVALYDAASDRILSVQTEMIGKGHAEKLMAQIEAALAEAGITLKDVGRIAVTIGRPTPANHLPRSFARFTHGPCLANV